jgi:uncharacterized protein (DUF1330 family)
MKSSYKLAIALLAGAAIGGAVIQGLHAQAKPPVYVITEVEIIDDAAFKEFSPKVAKTVEAAGGKYLARGGQVVALEGQAAPKRVVISTFDSMDKVQAWRNSAGWKELTPLREKAVKTRAYAVEGLAN